MKTPISFDIIKESETFNEVVDVHSNEVVLIAYANGSLYLNVPSESKSKKKNVDNSELNEEDIKLAFEPWYDYRDIDLNGWFTIEYDMESDKVHLKHFNTGKYLTVFNKIGIDDIVTLRDEKSENSQLVFEPVDSYEPDIMAYTTDTVFKIMSTPGEAIASECYIRVADEEDKKKLSKSNENDENAEFEAAAVSTVPIVVKEKCSVNEFDTFNLVFPQSQTYRELMFCKDTYTYISTFMRTLTTQNNPLEVCRDNIWGLNEIFYSINKFLKNELEGRVRSEYFLGEIIPYRQKMILKIGIGKYMLMFLEFLTTLNSWDDEEEWENSMIRTFDTSTKTADKFTNLIDLVFDCIQCMNLDYPEGKRMSMKYFMVLHKF